MPTPFAPIDSQLAIKIYIATGTAGMAAIIPIQGRLMMKKIAIVMFALAIMSAAPASAEDKMATNDFMLFVNPSVLAADARAKFVTLRTDIPWSQDATLDCSIPADCTKSSCAIDIEATYPNDQNELMAKIKRDEITEAAGGEKGTTVGVTIRCSTTLNADDADSNQNDNLLTATAAIIVIP